LVFCNSNILNLVVVGVIIIIILFFSSFILIGKNNFGHTTITNTKDLLNLWSIQNTYATEVTHVNTDLNTQYRKSEIYYKENDGNSKNKNETSNFNFIAVGDWDCGHNTADTLINIIDQDPELVLALGDLSYNRKAKCWLELIEPITDKTKIVIGNHESASPKLLKDYMNYFGLKEQYYSFNYKNTHFLALSTEIPFEMESKQYEFAKQDLEKYSKDPFIDWIIVFYHRQIYGSASGSEHEDDFRKTYHPLFEKYKVDLALQGHFHVYERTYPITFNKNDNDKPLVHDSNSNIYKNPKGTIFVTIGTAGAKHITLSSIEDFSAEAIDGKFGILDIALVSDQKTLTGTFIENGKKKEVMDEFKIIKED
jgi:calcineurin-like phosphoesterase family protein